MFDFTPSEKRAVIIIAVVILLSGAVQLIVPHQSNPDLLDYTESDSVFSRRSSRAYQLLDNSGSSGQIEVKRITSQPESYPSDLRTGSVNINSADEHVLKQLPRIGPAMARRIIDWRNTNGPFKKIEDLLKVKGIGIKTLNKLKPYITL